MIDKLIFWDMFAVQTEIFLMFNKNKLVFPFQGLL